MIFGTMGMRGGDPAAAGPPPSSEMVRDPTFDQPVYWEVGDPPGTSLGGGQAVGLDDSGVNPCSSTLLTPTVADSSYMLSVQELSSLSGSYRVSLRKSAGVGAQILLTTSDGLQLRIVNFTANDVYDVIEIQWFEFGITLGLLSLQPVAPE